MKAKKILRDRAMMAKVDAQAAEVKYRHMVQELTIENVRLRVAAQELARMKALPAREALEGLEAMLGNSTPYWLTDLDRIEAAARVLRQLLGREA